MLPRHDERLEAKSGPRRWLARPLVRSFLLGFVLFFVLLLFGPGFVDRYGFNRRPMPITGSTDVDLGNSSPVTNHPPSTSTPTSPSTWNERAVRVKDAYIHAYTSYKEYASGYDELLPLSLGHKNKFNGWGVTMVDSLDTMWIMGLREEFNKSMQAVAPLDFDILSAPYAPFFETVIRYLGGLLSAYAISGETLLLSRAETLGRKLLPVFNSTSGLPKAGVNTGTGATSFWSAKGPLLEFTTTTTDHNLVLFAEVSTCQLEYKYLAHLTGNTKFYQKAERAMDTLYGANVADGLFSKVWDCKTATPLNRYFSVGGAADSGYEYFLKQYLLSGKSETKARDQYIKSANGIIKNLFYLSPTRELLYVTDTNNTKPSYVLEHLSCFLPGLFALGVHTIGDELTPRDRSLHQWAATGLAHTCWIMYAESATGLGPEEVRFSNASSPWMAHVEAWEKDGRPGGVPPGLREAPIADGKGSERDYTLHDPGYFLRPETVETFFIMWKTTGDAKWRERGWAAFEAMEKHSRTTHGFASVLDVSEVPAKLKDDMPSFFLAETLKYLYLLFVNDDIISLDKWVFNTEAHPFPIFQWNDWEKTEYSIH